jgi:putative ABC transport system permease protein
MIRLGPVRTATGGVMRHKVQALVIAMVLAVSTASATLGLALLSATNAPFDHAFASQRGADINLTINTGRATRSELAATAHLSGVTAMAGPFPETTAQMTFQGQPFGQLTLVGRAAPGGSVDNVVLNSGHWVTGPGQIVLDAQGGGGFGPAVGSTITVTGGPHPVNLTVVGLANSITSTADGWVTPGQMAELPGAGVSTQLLYRFTSADTDAQVKADVVVIARALPPGSVAGAASWLGAREQDNGNGAIMEPFVLAFALIGLVMAVLIVGNVVSGAVVAGYYRIGVLKSIGLSPAQVVLAYLSRVGWPAIVGCVAGTVAGAVLATPMLSQSAGAYGVGSQSVPWWAMVVAPCGMLALTAATALGPSFRAGRLSATAAIAAGRAPSAGRGFTAHRIAARLRLPRPVTLGLAAPFARPGRSLVTLAAIAFGATAVIFAFGLSASLNRAEEAQNNASAAPVRVEPWNPGNPPVGRINTALRTQPGTLHYVALYETRVKSPMVTQPVDVWAYNGPSAWLGMAVIKGHWYDKPGEVDVNTAFLTQSGLAVGDSATLTIGSSQVPVRIAGEVFAPSSNPHVYGSTQTLHGLDTTSNLSEYDIGLRSGVNAGSYIASVNQALGHGSTWVATTPEGGKFYVIADALIGMLALMVAIAAALGVLNTVLMTTRDRVHDMGVFKALGMRPGQVIAMVVCSIAGPAVVAAIIAAPAAIALNSATLHAMAATAHTDVPASFTAVFPPSRLAVLSLAAILIAVAGAMLPASWAARARPAVALRSE